MRSVSLANLLVRCKHFNERGSYLTACGSCRILDRVLPSVRKRGPLLASTCRKSGCQANITKDTAVHLVRACSRCSAWACVAPWSWAAQHSPFASEVSQVLLDEIMGEKNRSKKLVPSSMLGDLEFPKTLSVPVGATWIRNRFATLEKHMAP